MARCYYCGGPGCSQCKKMTTSSYGEIEAARAETARPKTEVSTAPSPSGIKLLFEESDILEKGRTEPPLKDLLKKILPSAKPKEKLYGWYSKQAMRFQKGSFYSRPDGSEVLITCVTRDPNNHGTGWTDIQCIGEVVDWIRKG